MLTGVNDSRTTPATPKPRRESVVGAGHRRHAKARRHAQAQRNALHARYAAARLDDIHRRNNADEVLQEEQWPREAGQRELIDEEVVLPPFFKDFPGAETSAYKWPRYGFQTLWQEFVAARASRRQIVLPPLSEIVNLEEEVAAPLGSTAECWSRKPNIECRCSNRLGKPQGVCQFDLDTDPANDDDNSYRSSWKPRQPLHPKCDLHSSRQKRLPRVQPVVRVRANQRQW